MYESTIAIPALKVWRSYDGSKIVTRAYPLGFHALTSRFAHLPLEAIRGLKGARFRLVEDDDDSEGTGLRKSPVDAGRSMTTRARAESLPGGALALLMGGGDNEAPHGDKGILGCVRPRAGRDARRSPA